MLISFVCVACVAWLSFLNGTVAASTEAMSRLTWRILFAYTWQGKKDCMLHCCPVGVDFNVCVIRCFCWWVNVTYMLEGVCVNMSQIERVVVISEWTATYLLGLTALWAQASSQIVVLYPLSHVSCYQKVGYSFALLTCLTAGREQGQCWVSGPFKGSISQLPEILGHISAALVRIRHLYQVIYSWNVSQLNFLKMYYCMSQHTVI